jgi:4-amino-4-deoxy-L-arabinose transferase-like glycosyltransferase
MDPAPGFPQRLKKFFRTEKGLLLAVLAAAAAWKAIFLFWDVLPFNADEAVVALMARHILAGERPIFFYGQAYMGSLDAFLAAAGFLVFGQHVWVIRLVQSLLSLGVVFTTACLGWEAFDSPRLGLFAALLVAFPPVNGMLYTTVSLGGYGEALLIGNLVLLLAVRFNRRKVQSEEKPFPWGWGLLWGFLVGLGLWANGLTLVYSAPAGLYLLWNVWKKRPAWLGWLIGFAALGFALGSLPWWGYAVTQGIHRLIVELFGSAIAVEKTPWLLRTLTHLVSFLLLGVSATLGLRPPWSVQWLALPLLPFVLVFWLMAAVFPVRRFGKDTRYRGEWALLGGVMAVLVAGFVFTPFGADPSGRYFLPLMVPLAFFAARFILQISKHPWQRAALLALVIGYQLLGTVQCALTNPPGLTTQFYEPTIIDHHADTALIAFLQENGETRGYTTYWVAYPLAFQSQETLLFVPRLPYHLDLRYTPRDDRYPAYTEQVDASARVAYITARNPALDDTLREHFTALGVSWKEQVIGDYRVYYHLSRPVRPVEMGLGSLRE